MNRTAAAVPSQRGRCGRWCRRGRRRAGSHAAFTLVEVLIVAIILGILASVVVPSLGSASTPIPRSIADLIELDLRRARIESIGAVRETSLIVGKSGDSWWLQSVGKPDPANALPSSMRRLGSGNLAPFAGYALEIKFNGALAPDEEVAVAIFDANGTRDSATIELTLRSSARHKTPSPDDDSSVLARWRLDAQRTTLTEITTTTR